MASHRALAAVGAAIRDLLADRYPRGEFGILDVELVQPRDIEQGLTGQGFAILPWRVAINTQHRMAAPRNDRMVNYLPPSLPVDLSFVILPYSTSAEKQLHMLGWAMRALEDAGILSAAQLNDALGESAVFAPGEHIELICDPLSVADQLSIWAHMHGHAPIGVCYLARTAMLDSAQRPDAGPVNELEDFPQGTAVNRHAAYAQFNFLVDLGDGPHAGFQEVSGIGGSGRTAAMKIPPLHKAGDFTMKRGLIASPSLQAWLDEIARGDRQAPREVTILLQNEDRTATVRRWKLRGARIVKHTSGPFSAKGTDVAVEELTLSYERLDME